MIKDVVVNLNVGEKASPACDYAVSVAATFNAHLAGIAFLYDPIVPVSGAGYIPADVIEAQERDNEEATRTALDRFNAACSRAGVSAEPLTLSASFAGVGEQFSRIARRFDLSIVGQSEPESSAVEEIIAESALFESGRPVIVVPYIQKAPLKLETDVIDRRVIRNIVLEARRFSGLAIDTLVELTRDNHSDSTRYSAATALLDRGYGRPAQSLDLHLTAEAVTRRLSDMSDAELAALEARMVAAAPVVIEATVEGSDDGGEGANGEVGDSPLSNDDV